ncbi:MAG: carboxypeptidase-like regulatory domain-containing protein [Proteobacteria bacterium]|nr:carboxypeptidase-like regulatory domain-containing protein [Pseudomonadota bacterium]
MVNRLGTVFLKSLGVLLLVLGLTSQAFAQVCSLQGTVTDASNGLPIAGALITSVGSSTITETTTTPLGTTATITTETTITGTTLTDVNGAYCFGDMPGGTYKVTATATGYVPQTADDVVIVSGMTTVQDFSLVPGSTIKEVDIKFEPETLNTNNTGHDAKVTVKVQPPNGYTADQIIPESVIISGIGGNATNIEPIKWNIENDNEDDNDSHHISKNDDNDNSKLELKYNRQEVLDVIRLNQLTGSVEITVTGSLTDGSSIIGSDDVTVKTKK